MSELDGELFGQACMGEAADVVVHELSNVLNAIVLQAAVIQQQLDEPLRSELAVVREQGRKAADLLGQLRIYRRGLRPVLYPVDLNQVLQETRPPNGEPKPRLELAPDLPPVLGAIADIKLLAKFLIGNAAAVTPAGRVISVRTSHDVRTVRLFVEDGGPPAAAETLRHFFDPKSPGRDGSAPLELAACQSICRRLNAAIHAEGRADGVTLIVELKAAR